MLGLKDELEKEYTVLSASTGKEGLNIAQSQEVDLILLDIILPDADGFLLCRKLKENGIDACIIMLTAKDQISDKVKGLEMGSDDYITKPFSLEELKARIKALLRRKEASTAVEYKDGALEIDFRRCLAVKKKRKLALSLLELKILRFLISNKDKVVSREELLQQVWGYHSAQDTRTVDVHINALRKKIGNRYIRSVYAKGYIFSPS